MRTAIFVILMAQISVLYSMGEVILQDTFEKDKLNTLVWAPSDPKFV